MNIQKGKTYRVDAMLDLDIHVLNIVGFGTDYLELKVCYPYRRKPNEIIMDDSTYKVSYQDLQRWYQI